MLDHVERWRVPEQPAREHLAPAQGLVDLVALFNENLHESTGFRRLLPRQRFLASRQLDDDVTDPARFAGLHHQILGVIVALVEEAERGHSILDRSAILAFHDSAHRTARADRLWHLGGLHFGGLRALVVTSRQPRA
jgi:hypothetical protein